MDKSKVTQIAEEYLSDKKFFLVDVTVSKDNDIEIVIESQENSVTLEDCVGMSRFIESRLDRNTEDYALTVGSAGLSSPFKVFGQYKKAEGSEVELTLKNGSKIKGILDHAQENAITVTHTISEKAEGQKRAVRKSVTENFSLVELKSTKPIIRFK